MKIKELVFFVTLIVSLQFTVNSFGFDLGGALQSLGESISKTGKELEKGLQEVDINQSCNEVFDDSGQSIITCDPKEKQKVLEEPQQQSQPQQQIQSQRKNNNKQTKKLVSSNRKQQTNTVRFSSAQAGNTGWMVRVEIPGDFLEVFYKLPNNSDYKSMGLSQYTNTATGFLIPNQEFKVPCSKDKRVGEMGKNCEKVKKDIKIKYIDVENNEKGPFTIFFDGEIMMENFCKVLIKQAGKEMAAYYPGCKSFSSYDYRQQ